MKKLMDLPKLNKIGEFAEVIETINRIEDKQDDILRALEYIAKK